MRLLLILLLLGEFIFGQNNTTPKRFEFGLTSSPLIGAGLILNNKLKKNTELSYASYELGLSVRYRIGSVIYFRTSIEYAIIKYDFIQKYDGNEIFEHPKLGFIEINKKSSFVKYSELILPLSIQVYLEDNLYISLETGFHSQFYNKSYGVVEWDSQSYDLREIGAHKSSNYSLKLGLGAEGEVEILKNNSIFILEPFIRVYLNEPFVINTGYFNYGMQLFVFF